MNKIRITAATAVLGLVLMGASECNIGGKSDAESCQITNRTTTHITIRCSEDRGRTWKDTEEFRVPSDLYPRCQIGTYWDGCKGNG